MRTDTILFRAKRFAALTALASLAVIPVASPASSKPAHNQRQAKPTQKTTDTTTSAASPEAAQEAATVAAAAPASPAPVAPPLVSNGAPIAFSVPPANEFQIQVPDNPERLTLKFQVAGAGSLDAYLSFGVLPAKAGSNRAEYSYHAVTGSTSVDFPAPSSPPLRAGTYYLRLESGAPAGGYFVATAVPAVVQRQEKQSQLPSFFSQLLAPQRRAAVLWVAAFSCLGLVFLHGIGSARSHAKDIRAALDSLGVVADSLRDLKKSIADLPEALADYLRSKEAPAAASQEEAPAHSFVARLQQLLATEPTLVTARLVRDVARRAGGAIETEFGRNFGGYLAALDRAERMLTETARGSAGLDEEWAALNRAIGALQARHNPVFFLDVIDEAGRLGMPQKGQLLAALGIEEITPSTGLEILDLTSYQIERTTGMGKRSILDKVLSSGYRSRETGEVYRKPAIAVRLESGSTAEV